MYRIAAFRGTCQRGLFRRQWAMAEENEEEKLGELYGRALLKALLFNISLIHSCCEYDNCQKDMQSSCFGNHHSKLVNSPSAGSTAAHPSSLQAAQGWVCQVCPGCWRTSHSWTVQQLKVLPGWLAKLKMPWHKTAKLYPPHKFVQGLGVF